MRRRSASMVVARAADSGSAGARDHAAEGQYRHRDAVGSASTVGRMRCVDSSCSSDLVGRRYDQYGEGSLPLTFQLGACVSPDGRRVTGGSAHGVTETAQRLTAQ